MASILHDTPVRDDDASLAALSERQKMMQGLPYDAMGDFSLVSERLRARHLQRAYNEAPWPSVEELKAGMPANGPDSRMQILADLFGLTVDKIKSQNIYIEPPFYCDFGNNITFKGSFYCNFGCIILDCAQVTLGDGVLFAPDVQIYAATHALDVAERRAGLERAYPVEIGDETWVGGGVRIIGPVKIGKGCTIAAGAVVTKDIPDWSLAGGIPARVLKKIPPS
ncbi:uncharacterized protein L969DRAFT_90073 [Mixia osmundae IAM 14324]|uniref:Maltose/galactoside acetyltransferase domain-containing protein n=1 Tax=Mixia osmundae (strain CBS 9802 / IAM 14324 / JCM 22182 / KY 12970) TaxID=764103 RepID=G7EAX0_MIXOS|nr:uncharacterized protein L969DRAFT_90073 [Mixia osmundae IAM 14324]KEI37015.1 hypothetical protein L969DRAFT_90073 [Mixia osmundae IAM 14324]GAA99980.1 hypothetical protein E5Q_06683 [Mixia osmundae IAM 14324]